MLPLHHTGWFCLEILGKLLRKEAAVVMGDVSGALGLLAHGRAPDVGGTSR